MVEEVERDGKGRFKGSGNPRGRPEKRRIDPKLPAARRDVIMRVADRMVEVKVDGKGTTQRMSLYEANVFQLAISGAGGNRVSAQKFIDLAMSTSEQDLLMRVQNRMMIDRMNQVEHELYELQKKSGQGGGVLQVPWEEWQRHQHSRFDESSAEELLSQGGEEGTLPG